MTSNEELSSFARFADLDKSQISVLNVCHSQHFDDSVIHGFEALWVGGASDANVLQPEKYPFVEDAKSLLKFCKDNRVHVFVSCFGFQLAVLTLGGTIVDSDNEFEMGCLPISVAKMASKDILFMDMPSPFIAVSVHKQKALSIPADCELLAFTDNCIHAFKIKKPTFLGVSISSRS